MQVTLIRGLSREQFHWGPFVQILRDAFPQMELELLDLPGNGKHSSIVSPANPTEYVEFLRKQSTFIQQNKKTHVIAVSLAAMVTHLWAQTYPGELESFVMMNTSLRPTPIYYRMRPSGLLKLIAAARTKDLVEREKQILTLTTQMCGDKLDQLSKEWGEHARWQRTSLQSTINQLWSASLMKRTVIVPKVPCLILSSENDALVHPRSSEDLARAWHVPHRVHSIAGHDLTLDDPQWVVEQLHEFYQSIT